MVLPHPKAQVALVTGAGSGVGRGLALDLARRGLQVVACDLEKRTAAATVNEIQAGHGRASALALDVSDEAAVGKAIAALPDGRVDLLINNAGLQHVAPLEDFPPEKWRHLIEVMLIGPMLLARAVLPGMRARNFGRIVNIGSIHSLVASPFKSAYVAAKHGLLGLSKTLALETGEHDITVNTICPSYIRTPLVDAQIAAQAASHGISKDDVIAKIMLQPMPKKAFVTIEEIAETSAFLASDAARNITGQTIVIDGGWTAR